MKPIAYEGTKPYMFVSYAHKDASQVFEVLDELQKHGYRLWYDDGIAPGSEWPEDIAQHLDAAHMVLAFITPKSMASQNCRREINFSLSREKPFLSVLMEPTEMPLGMEMQLSAQQMIVRDNFDSWDAFVRKVMRCPSLAPCKGEGPTEPDSVEDTAPDAGPAPIEPTQPIAPDEVTAPAEPAVPPTPAAQGRVEAPAKKGGLKSKVKKVLGIFGAGIVALLAIMIVLHLLRRVDLSPTYSTSWGDEIKLESSSYSVRDKALTQNDLAALTSSPNLTTLYLNNCDLSACDFTALTLPADTLLTLDLSGSTGISDFSFLSGLTLRNLDLSGISTCSDLSPLNMSSLAILDISGTGISDLSFLANSTLEKLDFSGTPVSDISPLASIPSLRVLSGTSTSVTSIDALAGLEKLESVNFDGCSLSNPTSTFTSLRLTSLSLANAGITSMDAFTNCTILKELDLEGNAQLDSMDWLDPQNYATLTALNLAHTALGSDDLAWVTRCKGLTHLVLDGLALTDFGFCSNLGNLTHLSAVNCGIADISPLADSHSLKVVLLAHNSIGSIGALANLTDITNSSTIIDLSYNALSTVAQLPTGSYRALMLQGNASDIALTIPQGVGGYEVVIPWCEGIEKSALAEHPFSSVYLLGCPQNQVLSVQDALGSSRVKLVDDEALREIYANDSFDYALNLEHSPYLTEA